MLVPVLLFAVGLVLLIKGGDWFVDGATGLAGGSTSPRSSWVPPWCPSEPHCRR